MSRAPRLQAGGGAAVHAAQTSSGGESDTANSVPRSGLKYIAAEGRVFGSHTCSSPIRMWPRARCRAIPRHFAG